ncbi:hypothetical protein H6F67_19585 [Microcoleus sp. FACHB-1515]|nr:hypothetical protein [Microcoleus sp. FACHB-1515]MBD2092054.1 hypothetical protein [Microcoleus sp. FACHB-1515]
MLAKLLQAVMLTLFFQLWMNLSLSPAAPIAAQPVLPQLISLLTNTSAQ